MAFTARTFGPGRRRGLEIEGFGLLPGIDLAAALADLLAVDEQRELVVHRERELGAFEARIGGQRDQPAKEPLALGRIGGRIAFREPDPRRAVKRRFILCLRAVETNPLCLPVGGIGAAPFPTERGRFQTACRPGPTRGPSRNSAGARRAVCPRRAVGWIGRSATLPLSQRSALPGLSNCSLLATNTW